MLNTKMCFVREIESSFFWSERECKFRNSTRPEIEMGESSEEISETVSPDLTHILPAAPYIAVFVHCICICFFCIFQTNSCKKALFKIVIKKKNIFSIKSTNQIVYKQKYKAIKYFVLFLIRHQGSQKKESFILHQSYSLESYFNFVQPKQSTPSLIVYMGLENSALKDSRSDNLCRSSAN